MLALTCIYNTYVDIQCDVQDAILELLHQGQMLSKSFDSNTTKGPKRDSYNRQGLPIGIWTYYNNALIDWCLTSTWAVLHLYCILYTNHGSVINTDYWVDDTGWHVRAVLKGHILSVQDGELCITCFLSCNKRMPISGGVYKVP
jgi:hypothetical protein